VYEEIADCSFEELRLVTNSRSSGSSPKPPRPALQPLHSSSQIVHRRYRRLEFTYDFTYDLLPCPSAIKQEILSDCMAGGDEDLACMRLYEGSNHL
jgi:hypothetical protein